MEKFCIPEWSTFVALLSDTADHTCVTPTLLSPRRVVAISGNDAEEEEENEEENEEEKDEENEEENEEEMMAEQVSQLSTLSMSDSGREDDGSDGRENSQSVRKKWLEGESVPPMEQQTAKRRRLLSSSSSSLEMPPPPSLQNLSATVGFRSRLSLGGRRQ